MNYTQMGRITLVIIIVFGFVMAYRNIDMAWVMKIEELTTGNIICDMKLENTKECVDLMGKKTVNISALEVCDCSTPNEMYAFGLWQLFGTLFVVCIYVVCFGNKNDY